MNKLLVWCFAVFMSCANTPSKTSQKSQDMQTNAEILVSESQGGTDRPGFVMIKNEQELKERLRANFGKAGIEEIPNVKFPVNKKVILYYSGTFNSGDHTINEIKNISVKNNVLYVEVPKYESGGMTIQVMSNPWMIFTVPAHYQSSSVELTYSK
jgi:hypothetical protein